MLAIVSSCGKSDVGVTTDKDIFVQQVLLANPIEVPFTFDTVAVAEHEIFMPLQVVGLSPSTYVVVDGTNWSLSMLNDNGELLSSIAPIGLGPEEWVQVNAISANDGLISIIDSRQSRVVTVDVTPDSLNPLRTEHFRVSETGSIKFYFEQGDEKYYVFQKNPVPSNFRATYTLAKSDLTSENYETLTTFMDSESISDMSAVMFRFSNPLIDIDNESGKFAIGYTDSLDVNIFDPKTKSSHRINFSVNMERANLKVNKEFIQNSSSTDTYKSIATVKSILPALKKLVLDGSTLYLHLAYFGADHNLILIHDIDSDQTVHVKAPIGFTLFDAIGGTLYGTIPNSKTYEPEIGILKVDL
jgi:hypothetical protein